MKRWPPIVVLLLLVLPIVAFVAVGAWTLWETGRWWWMWWSLPICWGLAYVVARQWQARMFPPPGAELEPSSHWTPHDEQALRIIQQQQEAVKAIPPEKLTDPHFFLNTAQQLALKIARHYHPKAKDPLGSLTVPEILAVAHLASEELETWVQKYLPGSHLLTVDQWRTLSKAPGWFRVAGDVSWVVAMMLHPANIARYITSKLTMDSASRQVQANVLAWFYVLFVRHVGYYLIEMNSGRLRGGADKYRAAMDQLRDQGEARSRKAASLDEPSGADESTAEPVEVTVAIVGQVKAGKSSLVNALLGERRAATDVLPLTQGIQRYELELTKTRDRLVLLDTVGYGSAELTQSQTDEIRAAFRQADLVLLVMRANSPAREADLRLIRHMSRWYGSQLPLKPPPVVAVLTHIDGLSPLMEWSPPYEWQTGTGAKERSIQEAIEHTRQQFGEHLSGVIPVCTDLDRGRAYGAQQWLLPAMTAMLDEAHACALIRTLRNESDSRKVQRLLGQMVNAGRGFLFAYLWGEANLPSASGSTEGRSA